MEDLEALRTNTEGFEFICEHVISEIIGRAKFEKRARKELVSTFVTRSTEAFAVLLMDNFREMIIERGQKEKEKKVKKGTLRAPTTAKAKYTNKGRGAKKFRGWSKEGLQKYNSLMNKVRIDREEEAKKNYPVEKEYRRALIEVEESSESAKKRKMNGQEENEETMEMEIED